MRGYLFRMILPVATVLMMCCGGPSGEAALTVTVPGADKDPHKKRVQELLQIIADGIEEVELPPEMGHRTTKPDMESFKRWHGARKELPKILRADDVPMMEELVLKHSWWTLRKPKKPMSDDEKMKRLSLARQCMRILRDYYIRTNDPQVTAFYLELLPGMNRGYLVGSLLHSVVVGDDEKTRKHVFLPGLEKTDWPEAFHREYLKLETTEAQMTACDLLYAGEKYKDEATWLYCRILKESDRVYSAEKMVLVAEKRREAHMPAVTPREAAVIHALGMMFGRSMNAQDRELYAKYVIPWAKHFAAEGTPAVKMYAKRLLDPDYAKGWDIDLDKIPAGTPVPPKPDTVVEPETEKPEAK